MRVAIVCPYAWDRPGGVQSHISSLAECLRGRDHDVLIVAPRSRSLPEETGVVLTGRAIPIPANGSIAALAFGPDAAAGVRRVLLDFEPDVIHLHEPLIPSLSLLALARANAPCVGTFHAAADSSAGYRLGQPILRLAARKLAVRTAVSDAARALIQRYLPGEYHLTPNGIDTGRFADAPPADLGSGKKVLFLGRLERRKGLEVLLQAMTRLRDRDDIELVVAGTGPEEKQLRALAESLLVNARFLGRVDDETKAGLFKRADLYCAPGLGGESFGIVLVEAMAAGTPVVCSDLPGFRAVAAGTAVLVTPGDAGLLADAARRVLDDESLASKMGKSGARTASGFDWARLVGNVESLYRRATKEPLDA
jgi:phosphatidyl-myo-inositol alpha-mannosyltransferase